MASTSYFANSHSFIISGGNFATVYGNQIINYFNCEHERKTALTIYDQFRQVIQGDIYRTADVGVYKYPRTWDDGSRLPWEKGQLRADKTVCSAEVIGTEGRMFTVVSYTGPEAREAFEKDFQAYSITLTASSFQVYGINTHVPTVLFYGEPQPAAKFSSGLGFWGKAYLTSLREQFDCDETELWMDVKKGTLCRGPVGPSCELPGGYIEWANLSSSVEFLQDANCLRFLANLKSKKIDQSVVAVTLEYWRDGVSEVEVHQPTVLSTLTNTTIAVQVGESWHAMGMGCLGERDVMENGETRFTLEDKGGQVLLTTYSGHRLFWISQASSVFYSCGISFDDDLSQYEIIWPYVGLDRPLSMSVTACQRRREKPIYIFVRPLSLPLPTEEYKTSSFHYWSFDPTGQSPLPANICEDLGLPVELSVRVWSTARYYCDNQSYKSMHQYQLARGFDPATSDFARHLGYPIYKVHDDSDRFEDFDAATVSLTQPSPDRSTSVATGKTVQPSSMLIEQNISKFAHRSSTRPPTTSKKVNAAAARKEDILVVKPAAPQKMRTCPAKTGSLTPKKHRTHEATVPSRSPPTTNSKSPSSRTSRRPRSLAATTSTLPRSPAITRSHSPQWLQRRPVPTSTISPACKGIANAKSGLVSRASRAPVTTQRQPPPPSKPIHTVSTSPKFATLRSATTTSAPTCTANASTSSIRGSQPRIRSDVVPSTTNSASRPQGGSGIEGDVRNCGTYSKHLKTQSNRARERRIPTISTPNKVTSSHEQSSLSSKRAWR